MNLTKKFLPILVFLLFLNLAACKSSSPSTADANTDPAENTDKDNTGDDAADEGDDDTASEDETTEEEAPQIITAGVCTSYTYDALGVELTRSITSAEYDSLGYPTTIYQDSDGDGINTSFTEYTYSEDGSKILATSNYSLDIITQEETLEYRSEYEFDSNGNEVLNVLDSNSDGIGTDDIDGQFETATINIYNLNQQLHEVRAYENGVLASLETYTYNAEHLLDTKEVDSNGDGTIDHIYSYSYNADDRISIFNYTYPANAIYDFSYTYSYAGNSIDYYIVGSSSCVYNSTTYDSPEYEQLQSYYYWIDENCNATLDIAENVYEYTYTYPDDHTTERSIALNGVEVYSEINSSTVDADGNILSEITQDLDGDGDIDSYSYNMIMPPEFALESGEDSDYDDILENYTSCTYTYE